MTLAEYLSDQPHGRMKEIEREACVGYSTLARIRAGSTTNDYRVAKAISHATGGAVSLEELCEGAAHAAQPSLAVSKSA